ncbi:hypothetical protein LEP1GSC133_0465 [Leptospira borgpetersenii serovar Pomona str. 200901868]|uniref:Uncharacterized protein n=3 Tax=Leptospira borgpetersenii TaxID=174 RepID=A0A0S2IVZ4_LEPBO|nr:hypothetical protein LBBP_03671 [Leptospira borgpetersenii serovar Ballum]EKP13080.1 hypothetical protein LEP1GSC128_3992 [Leptospira borgpetersenii str. 200801926]EKR00173.1 hypothetical protein LEP1GSC121_3673 [Leptospira borgpetersenii serovar Castellonis str. 200801910]EMK13445.1 hypothetical protein LEP1GSC066_2154 [Leptospira sp. serovar Kenya str. Sh9]EMN12205.1 hypothetical protein LEP1GSC055_2300 [Leptospira borgpetersenii str. Brem 307]EMO61749.1 hypothetical protein LEP1GSC133_04
MSGVNSFQFLRRHLYKLGLRIRSFPALLCGFKSKNMAKKILSR